ncbi:MAG: hypothetical protein AB7O45_07510 [Alphaproteobacteria bacterium]
MAVLSNADRRDVWAEFQRTPEAGETFALSKADLRAAVDAIDQWIDDNAPAFNAAIPQPARGALTAWQKARLFSAVLRRRFERA